MCAHTTAKLVEEVQIQRAKFGIFEIAERIKKRASVYGIYNFANKLHVGKLQVKNMDKKLHDLKNERLNDKQRITEL